jgi:hypothetical protein
MVKFMKNVFAYLQGNIRYKIYYGKFKFILSLHIEEQIEWRISVMDKECKDNGECKMCGCKTTALQMADKACSKPCYPKMMDRHTWRVFKDHGATINGFKYELGSK